MRDFIRRHRLLILVVPILVLLSIWGTFPSMRGQLVAQFDVARGHYEVQTYGLPGPWIGDYSLLLRDRYGIQLRPVGGCVVSGSVVSYANAYNSVAVAAATQRFGRDIFGECETDARKRYEKLWATSAPSGQVFNKERIIAIARQAVADNDTWADQATYEVQHTDSGWSVVVWRIEGYDNFGKPQVTPGGYRVVVIDQSGKVTRYIRGR